MSTTTANANATANAATASPGSSNATASATSTVNVTSTPPPVTVYPPPPPSSSSDSPSTSSPPPSKLTGVYVGITVGAVVIILVLIILCIYYSKKKREPKDDSGGGRLGHQQLAKPPPSPTAGSHPPQSPGDVPKPGSSFARLVNKFIITRSGGENPVPAVPSPVNALGISGSTFTYGELERATDGFSGAKFLGEGGFGHVHRGLLPNGKEVAVKQLKAGSGHGERHFQAEIETISRIHHKHLVSLVGYCIAGTHRLLLVYEFVPNDTLYFHLHGEGQPTIDWPTRLKIALGAAKGLAYLHEECHPKIIHRDIKAANILLDFNFEAKIVLALEGDRTVHISPGGLDYDTAKYKEDMTMFLRNHSK